MGILIMKNINTYINERLHITSKQQYSCQPTTLYELQQIIIQRIKDDGPECDLNDIDVSKITDMSELFNANKNWNSGNKIFKYFNGDISLWNVSNVTNMCGIFNWCEKFNCDLSRWNVSNVTDMECMFNCCYNFNSDISKWDVSNVENIGDMFYFCKNFKQNLDRWDVSNVNNMETAFYECPTKPKWYDEDKWE